MGQSRERAVTVLRLAEGLVLRADWSRQQRIDKEL